METADMSPGSVLVLATALSERIAVATDPAQLRVASELLSGAIESASSSVTERLADCPGGPVKVSWNTEHTVWGVQAYDDIGRLFAFGPASGSDEAELRAALSFRLAPAEAGEGDVFVARVGHSDTLYLMHGRKGAPTVFAELTRAAQINISHGDTLIRASFVADVRSSSLLDEVAMFVQEVIRIQGLKNSPDFHPTGQVVEEGPSFLDLQEEGQVDVLWQVLLGQGALSLDDAVRQSAVVLRDRGMAEYQRLRAGGELYERIAEVLREAGRAGKYFDRPKRGTVRAVLREAAAFSIDQWRDCLMSILPSKEVEREEAVRAAAAFAVDQYGLEHERLRSGGRVERGLRGAINSAIRRGMVEALSARQIRRLEAHHETVPISTVDPSDEESQDSTAGPASGAAPPMAGAPADRDDGKNPFDAPLTAFLFPARTFGWARRAGVTTIGDLARWNPADLSKERNVGRGTVRKTRLILEGHLGRLWEEARSELVGPEPESEAEGEQAAGGWDGFLGEVPAEFMQLCLDEIELPARMQTFVQREDISTIAELFGRSKADLIGQPNFGRRSLSATIDAVRSHIEEARTPFIAPSFLVAWRAELARLEPTLRFVLSRRAGTASDPETLDDLGQMLGVTREWVRQIELDGIEALGFRRRWLGAVEMRIEAVLAGGRTATLAALLQDPWWAGLESHLHVLAYILKRLFSSRYSVIGFGEARMLSAASQEAFDIAWTEVIEKVRALEYPVSRAAIESVVTELTGPLGTAAAACFFKRLEEYLHFGEDEQRTVLAFGRNKRAEVLAVLRESPSPIPVAELYAAVGRCAVPDEVLFFGRGIVGLRQHFPDFEGWQANLVPRCIEIMRRGGPTRQWSVLELRDTLADQVEVPVWLGHWHLAGLLRTSGEVQDLGRLRVALPDGQGEIERIHFAEHLVEVLEDARTSLSIEDIAQRARKRTDIPESTLRMALLRRPFVKLDVDLYGLLERDVPGGAEAIAQAVDCVLDLLASLQRPVQMTEIRTAICGISGVHHAWTIELIKSILRNEQGLRLTRRGDVRVAASGEDDDEELESVTPAKGGTSPQEQATEGADRPFSPADAVLLSRVPDESRPLFRKLLTELPRPPSVLLEEVAAHVRLFEKSVRDGGPADLRLAQKLSVQSRALLDIIGLSPEEQRVIRAAVRYFVITDDGGDDLEAGGLDDDAAVLDAVILHLDLESRMPVGARRSTNPSGRSLEISVSAGDSNHASLLADVPPQSARELESLLKENPRSFAELAGEVEDYLGAVRSHTKLNKFIDLHLAERIAEACLGLLSSEPADADARAVIQASARYFLTRSDAENDFDSLFGFEDDAIVINAALRYLGREASSIVP